MDETQDLQEEDMSPNPSNISNSDLQIINHLDPVSSV